ncbi:MAG: RNA-binding transcriptional accessory protein, partial [Syntrophaceae bacterium]|nr:RNA-binding transcriptional accessory protein [Syntrophaceae bacterium]
MSERHIVKIAADLNVRGEQVRAAARLLDDEATVPFIARYRKEVTGGLDEVAIITIRDQLESLRALDKRREAILKSLEEQGKLTDELKEKVSSAETMAILEDIYLPYRPKRRTRGTIAKEKGLEPLAVKIFTQADMDIEVEAASFVNPEKGVETAEDALAGARDIIAEWINEKADLRAELRELFAGKATIKSRVIKGKEEEGIKYKDYYEWEEPAATAPSHRILAIRRGADEGYLTFHILPDEEAALSLMERRCVKNSSPAAEQVRLAARDSYKRLLSLSMETEMRVHY